MTMSRRIFAIAVAWCLPLAACGDGNPLIGKWLCRYAGIGNIRLTFTRTAVEASEPMIVLGRPDPTARVAYARDGPYMLVDLQNGTDRTLRFRLVDPDHVMLVIDRDGIGDDTGPTFTRQPA